MTTAQSKAKRRFALTDLRFQKQKSGNATKRYQRMQQKVENARLRMVGAKK